MDYCCLLLTSMFCSRVMPKKMQDILTFSLIRARLSLINFVKVKGLFSSSKTYSVTAINNKK
ncbi:hypothetical protein BDA99DRAFT_182277 [Phascolomyces articulosus]|uniref:Uncharacterized protein n=1 Tax=Phascolomyces articulosus TaxID=60185 RepID=A0AAD5K5I2_9FUNG|nr:hypothetical protein BDA99DRAFT_182277 [Phascolomyces articulosus]